MIAFPFSRTLLISLVDQNTQYSMSFCSECRYGFPARTIGCELSFCAILKRWFIIGGFYSQQFENVHFELLFPSPALQPESKYLICDPCVAALEKKRQIMCLIDQSGRWLGPDEWRDEWLIIKENAWRDSMENKWWMQGRTLDQLQYRVGDQNTARSF